MAAKEIGGEGVKNQLLISMEKSKHFLVTQPLLFFFCSPVIFLVLDAYRADDVLRLYLHVHVFCLL